MPTAGERITIKPDPEMHHLSGIFARATESDNQFVTVRVGGNCVEVPRGEIILTISQACRY